MLVILTSKLEFFGPIFDDDIISVAKILPPVLVEFDPFDAVDDAVAFDEVEEVVDAAR